MCIRAHCALASCAPVKSNVMPLKRPPLKRVALLLLTVAPVVAWALVKPVRVVLPELAGVSCVSSAICTDDLSRLPQAQELYSEAISFVSSGVAQVHGTPRIIFCANQDCADRFGLGARSAVTVGTVGTVIGPKAWKPFYVRHELIHYLQAQKLGVLPLLVKPSWYVEGMAYGLSQDPRVPLAEPLESYRSTFTAWYVSVGKEQLWSQAPKW
jgi:hypothetical protein